MTEEEHKLLYEVIAKATKSFHGTQYGLQIGLKDYEEIISISFYRRNEKGQRVPLARFPLNNHRSI